MSRYTSMASQRQIEANRRNWAKRGPLTPAGRERLRQAALRNKPWKHSTGPRMPEGKARSRANALGAGGRARTLEPYACLNALRPRKDLYELIELLRRASEATGAQDPEGRPLDALSEWLEAMQSEGRVGVALHLVQFMLGLSIRFCRAAWPPVRRKRRRRRTK